MPQQPPIQMHNPEELGPHPGFSHAASAAGLVFVSGQIGADAGGRVVSPGEIVAQFTQAIRNVATALAAAGAGPEHALKLTYFVTDREAYRSALAPIGSAYREVFGRHYPATSLFEVKGLFDPEAMVEIECVAILPGK
jgi:enamine deaminase RidA (YjgF/YER057c/UK114 family)